MTLDALDPGPNNTFPYVPRDADGYLDEARMPVGLRTQRGPDARPVTVDLTPTVRLPDGRTVPITDVVPRRPPVVA